MTRTGLIRDARADRKPGPLERDGSRITQFLLGLVTGIFVSLVIVHLSLTVAQRQLAKLQAEQAVPAAVELGSVQT